jgi:hypothetical protein
MVDIAQKAATKRRIDGRPRFSLKTAVVIVCMLSVVFAFSSNHIRSQKYVIREVERREGHVWNVSFADGGRIDPPYPKWLPSQLHGFAPKHVNFVYLTGNEIHDADLDTVAQQPNLEGLNISSSSITDAGLEKLHRCTRLQELQLYDVTAVSLEAIQGFKRAVPQCKVQR